MNPRHIGPRGTSKGGSRSLKLRLSTICSSHAQSGGLSSSCQRSLPGHPRRPVYPPIGTFFRLFFFFSLSLGGVHDGWLAGGGVKAATKRTKEVLLSVSFAGRGAGHSRPPHRGIGCNPIPSTCPPFSYAVTHWPSYSPEMVVNKERLGFSCFPLTRCCWQGLPIWTNQWVDAITTRL
jgi:hypothetical protein